MRRVRARRNFWVVPAKGTIAIGSDADLVIYDPAYQGVISAKTHHVNNNYSGFEGMVIEGAAFRRYRPGKVQAKDGKFVGDGAAGVC